MRKIVDFQNRSLSALANKIDDFYLAGGTALSLYYFNHRESEDLDFFTSSFDKVRIFEVAKLLSIALKNKAELVSEVTGRGKVKILVYLIHFGATYSLKIDFLQDYFGLIKPPKLINGIKVMALEDIYVRKIYAMTGSSQARDSIGRKIIKGGRQEAKDFYDVYCLSSIFTRLSDFSFKYCNSLTREAIIRWFRSYKRLDIKLGLLELRLKNKIDYSDIERHFKKEVDRILEKEVDFL